MELGLELVAVVGPNHFDAERDLRDNVIDKVDGTLLVVFRVSFDDSDSSGIVDGRVLVTFDEALVLTFQA